MVIALVKLNCDAMQESRDSGRTLRNVTVSSKSMGPSIVSIAYAGIVLIENRFEVNVFEYLKS